MSKEENLNGLSGWLVLVGIGIIISPIRLIATYFPLFSQIFTDGTWEALTVYGSETYNPLWAPLIIGEIVYNSVIVLFSLYLIFLYFSKNYLFPRIYIILSVLSFVFIPLDAWMSSFVLPDEKIFDEDTAKEFSRAVFGVVVWVPYMLFSKRVKATFIEKSPNRSLKDAP